MGDGVYQDIFEALKPGVRENEIVALANKRLYEMGSDCVEAINAISGERCSPHPHNFTDRIIRPGDQAFFDIIQSYVGYRTCYYRTFSVGRATAPQRDAYKQARASGWTGHRAHQAGRGAPTASRAPSPARRTSASRARWRPSASTSATGSASACTSGRSSRGSTRSTTRWSSRPGMIFAVETYCPATDGISAARIEEEVIVTPRGAQIITLFPADELPIANRY